MSASSFQHYRCNLQECCQYVVAPYTPVVFVPSPQDLIDQPRPRLKKSGIFMYDEMGYVLLVQSRGQLWGPPKGSIQANETPLACALRETKEETGFDVTESDFSGSVVIKTRALYYFTKVDRSRYDLHPQVDVVDNDANGIGWFRVDCLNRLITEGKIQINQHCRILVQKIFEVELAFNADSLSTSSVHTRLLCT